MKKAVCAKSKTEASGALFSLMIKARALARVASNT
jgi:hypothetical protein